MSNIFDNIPEYDYTTDDRHLDLLILCEQYKHHADVNDFDVFFTRAHIGKYMYDMIVSARIFNIQAAVYINTPRGYCIHCRWVQEFSNFNELYAYLEHMFNIA